MPTMNPSGVLRNVHRSLSAFRTISFFVFGSASGTVGLSRSDVSEGLDVSLGASASSSCGSSADTVGGAAGGYVGPSSDVTVLILLPRTGGTAIAAEILFN